MDALRVTLLVASYFGNNSPGNSVSSNIDTGIPERSKVVLPVTSSKLTNPRILLLLSDTNNINRVRVETNGNLRALNDLVVEGAAYNNTAFDAGSATTIDFQQSNLAYTINSAQNNFTLQNLKDGGTYTLSVRGTSSGTASFTATGFSFRSVSNVSMKSKIHLEKNIVQHTI